MELTEEQWQKLGQHLPQNGDFLFSLLPNSDYMLNAVRHGVVLNSRMLVYLLLTERDSLVFTLIAAAERHTDGVYDFMCTVCGENAAMDFIVRHELKDMYRHLTPAYLRDRELWELLAENGEYQLLADNGQYDLLEQKNQWVLLAGCGQYERIIRAEKWDALKLSHEGMEKLAQLGLWKHFYDGREVSLVNGFSETQILERLWEGGQQQLLFEFREDKFLLGKGWVKPYQDNGLWGSLTAYGHADQVDWEAIGENSRF
ncbi:MAG: hypothetical protein ACLSE6_06515 [Alphaproteobacteria bacterium]